MSPRIRPPLEGRALLWARLGEREWQLQVQAWAKAGGWRYYFTFNSYGSAKGFPDMVLVRRGRVIFVELKTMKGTLSDDQIGWRGDLEQCPGIEYKLWRPSDEDEVRLTLIGR